RFDGERVRIGNYVLPVDAQGRVCLGYARNAKTALEVLPFERLAGAMLGESGRALDPATIRGRIVIIGSSAFLSDRVATPVGQLTGSYALGLATAMIAGGQLMSPPQSAWSAILLVIAVLPVFSLLAWPAGGSPTIVVSTLSALVCIEAIQLGLLALDRQESAALLPVAIAVIGGLLMSGRQTWLARAQQEARIDAVTHTDALTGLPNRVAFQESLRAAIATAEAEGRSLSLLVLGIDHFQMINDGMGHAAGDELLQALTERLDASRGWSRLGGDEYALIFHGRAVDALEFAHRALRSLKAPFGVAGSSVHITAGVGIAHFPQDGRNEVGLRQSADVALHQAKSLGEGVVREFVAEQGQNVKDQMLLQSELHRAVINGELTLYCQPQIEIAGGRIVAAEFLVRWNHPVRGLLVPAQFIPFAEKSNLILEIDEWVLRESCRQIKAWHDSGLSHLTLGAVNLSARQFQQSDLPAQVERVLAETGLAPRFLELEITESLAMSDPEHTTRTLQALAEMGVALAVDDFGTGYSSLAYLKRFPIDIVKIDRAFVRDIEKEGLDAKLCAGVIDLAHRLEFDTIAEGVETVGQLERLAEFGCKKAQGYLIGRPIPASQMALVEGRRAGHPVIQRGDNASSLKVS
ncbi:MAG: EAL domain-containing protein, partial [Burkholderiales bacterium]|nr:EAL domain-containing protein [Burkholderiales bacterium]